MERGGEGGREGEVGLLKGFVERHTVEKKEKKKKEKRMPESPEARGLYAKR